MIPNISPATLANSDQFLDNIGAIDSISADIGSILRAIECEANGANNAAIISSLARAGQAHTRSIETVTAEFADCLGAFHAARESYDQIADAMANAPETDEGQALRDLSRDLAVSMEKIALPAFRAITEMQNKAGEIDAMIRRARDMAGCLRWEQPADRDPDLPEQGSLSAIIGETMDGRTVAFAAAIARAKARRLGENVNAA